MCSVAVLFVADIRFALAGTLIANSCAPGIGGGRKEEPGLGNGEALARRSAVIVMGLFESGDTGVSNSSGSEAILRSEMMVARGKKRWAAHLWDRTG